MRKLRRPRMKVLCLLLHPLYRVTGDRQNYLPFISFQRVNLSLCSHFFQQLQFYLTFFSTCMTWQPGMLSLHSLTTGMV